jgi:tRNA threonylcarbamoyladenosine biosynthesis protein TsaE
MTTGRIAQASSPDSPEKMAELARALGSSCRAGDVIALVGDLGAGKTVFVKGLAQGLGVPDSVLVTSPTFTLVNEYQGGRHPLVHVDLYRLSHERELEDVGLDELYRREVVVAVEWFDRFPTAAPAEYLEVRITARGESQRCLVAEPHGARAAELLGAWQAHKSWYYPG